MHTSKFYLNSSSFVCSGDDLSAASLAEEIATLVLVSQAASRSPWPAVIDMLWTADVILTIAPSFWCDSSSELPSEHLVLGFYSYFFRILAP